MIVVVDASVLVAVLVRDARQETARAAIDGWLLTKDELHAPAVLPYELANVLARRVFDGALTMEDVADIWSDVAALAMVLHPFDLTRDGLAVAAVTARLRRRHATDSTYIWLAQRLKATLWTLDAALARNAADVGLPVTLIH